MFVQSENINRLESDQDVIEYERAWEEFENFDIEIPRYVIINAYVKRDEYYNRRYDNFAPNNLKFNLDKLLMYYVLDQNRINDLERAIEQSNFREFYSLLNIEEMHLLGW